MDTLKTDDISKTEFKMEELLRKTQSDMEELRRRLEIMEVKYRRIEEERDEKIKKHEGVKINRKEIEEEMLEKLGEYWSKVEYIRVQAWEKQEAEITVMKKILEDVHERCRQIEEEMVQMRSQVEEATKERRKQSSMEVRLGALESSLGKAVTYMIPQMDELLARFENNSGVCPCLSQSQHSSNSRPFARFKRGSLDLGLASKPKPSIASFPVTPFVFSTMDTTHSASSAHLSSSISTVSSANSKTASVPKPNNNSSIPRSAISLDPSTIPTPAPAFTSLGTLKKSQCTLTQVTTSQPKQSIFGSAMTNQLQSSSESSNSSSQVSIPVTSASNHLPKGSQINSHETTPSSTTRKTPSGVQAVSTSRSTTSQAMNPQHKPSTSALMQALRETSTKTASNTTKRSTHPTTRQPIASLPPSSSTHTTLTSVATTLQPNSSSAVSNSNQLPTTPNNSQYIPSPIVSNPEMNKSQSCTPNQRSKSPPLKPTSSTSNSRLNLPSSELNVALREAAKAGVTSEVHRLVSSGADVNSPDTLGTSALHWAAIKGRADTAHVLINAGAEVNARDVSGWTPLHFAASKAHDALVDLLLRHGAAVHCCEAQGQTPLHLAARATNAEGVRLILEAGASPDARDALGRTAEEVADGEELRQMLRKAAR